MSKLQEEVRLEGIGVSEGVGIGILCFLQSDDEMSLPEFAITSTQVSREISRYRRALCSSRDELERLQFHLAKEGSKEAVGIIDSHIQMLEDPIMTTVMEQKIAQMMQNSESVFRAVMSEYGQFFSGNDDEGMHQKWVDVKDLVKRILRHLNPVVVSEWSEYPKNAIISAYEMVPTFIAEASPSQIQAFVTEIGGETSHAALIAKAKHIPFVTNIRMNLLENVYNEEVVVDGDNGVVIVSPAEETLQLYREKISDKKKAFFHAVQDCSEISKTTDGREIAVWANLESMDDLPLIQEYSIGGIGLIRTEFLFFRKPIEELTEQQQISVYEAIMKSVDSETTVSFRVFDIGADKKLSRHDAYEPNPALGCRSIRYLMQNQEIFRTQLRALFTVAKLGTMRIILPLITDIDELDYVQKFIEDVKSSIPYDLSDVDIGCMVEVPSFALLSDHFAKKCQFFSIGTNDLVQYTLAVDRCSPDMQGKAHPAHPSILRMISTTVQNAKNEGIPVSICGEIASSPLFVPLIIGLGIEVLSVSPRYIPLVKSAVENVSLEKSRELAEKALQMASFHEIHNLFVTEFSRCALSTNFA